MKIIDFRSDTVTQPTEEMREAMARAPVGDDGYSDDPTVNRLEELAAAKVGKEAAVFVVSGVMGNLASTLAHTNHGDEVIAEKYAHMINNEVGGMAAIAGCLARTVAGTRGAMDPSDIDELIRPAGAVPRTALVCVENTHNNAGGTVVPLSNMRAIKALCEKHSIPVHLDGARVFNAAAAMGVDVKEIAACTDSLMFCLSKGLGAPVGSIVAGTRDFIKRVRVARKRLGGTLRQAGIVAAAGIVALEKMIGRLVEDHKNAARLAEGLTALGFELGLTPVESNMVFVKPPGTLSTADLAAVMGRYGMVARGGGKLLRLVTHHQISNQDIEDVLQRFAVSTEVARALRK